MTFELRNADEVSDAFKEWVSRAEQAMIDSFPVAGQIVIDEARGQFGNGSGPDSVTGELEGSFIVTDPVRVGFEEYEAKVGPSGVIYARKVELGKSGAGHSGPHPYLQPGLEAALAAVVEVFREAWGKSGRR